MKLSHVFMGLVAIVCSCTSLRADSPSEIYQRRVIPLLQSSKASSCSQCHLQGVKLNDFLTADPKESFAALRARGWIDIDKPDESKLLQFIAKQPDSEQRDNESELIAQVRESELEAIGEWIRASVRDPESLNAPLPELNDLKLDGSLIQHARTDRVLSRFVDLIWSQFERCANCHSPDRNAKQVEKNGEQMSWIVPNSPSETLRLLEQRGLINIDEPSASFLRTKALGQDDHGGGIKFPVDGQTDREWLGFLNDYAAIKNARYASSTDIPTFDSIRTWRTGLHLRIKDISNVNAGQYAVVLVHRVRSDGTTESDPVAFGEGRVGKDGSSWGTTLVILEPTSLRRSAESVDWKSLFPDASYQMRWMIVDDS